MARIHLFEFGDQNWFPIALRNYETDFLQFLSNKTKMYQSIVPLLEDLMQETKQDQIIDIASGGGGGLVWLNQELKNKNPKLNITLTDFYPNIPAFEYTSRKSSNFKYITDSIDAKNVPKNLVGIRTQFLSLHHFKERDAKQILQNAVDCNSPIAIFEGQERSFPSLLAMFLSPLSVIFTTPFIKPFKLGRIIFTYFIPIMPFVVWWDGIVSSLRTYSVAEMHSLVEQLKKTNDFEWKIGKVKSGPSVILYLIGKPKNIN